jgi:hypothetical protein
MTNTAHFDARDTTDEQVVVDNGAVVSGAPCRIARDIERGVTRLLLAHGIVSVVELPLPDGHRADVVGIGGDGRIIIVEIKSGVADFRSDRKWEAYRAYCDGLYFAVAADFPVALLPDATGLILADRYGGDFARAAPAHPFVAARRKAMTLRFARASAARLTRYRDPDGSGGGDLV